MKIEALQLIIKLIDAGIPFRSYTATTGLVKEILIKSDLEKKMIFPKGISYYSLSKRLNSVKNIKSNLEESLGNTIQYCETERHIEEHLNETTLIFGQTPITKELLEEVREYKKEFIEREENKNKKYRDKVNLKKESILKLPPWERLNTKQKDLLAEAGIRSIEDLESWSYKGLWKKLGQKHCSSIAALIKKTGANMAGYEETPDYCRVWNYAFCTKYNMKRLIYGFSNGEKKVSLKDLPSVEVKIKLKKEKDTKQKFYWVNGVHFTSISIVTYK